MSFTSKMHSFVSWLTQVKPIEAPPKLVIDPCEIYVRNYNEQQDGEVIGDNTLYLSQVGILMLEQVSAVEVKIFINKKQPPTIEVSEFSFALTEKGLGGESIIKKVYSQNPIFASRREHNENAIGSALECLVDKIVDISMNNVKPKSIKPLVRQRVMQYLSSRDNFMNMIDTVSANYEKKQLNSFLPAKRNKKITNKI